MPNALKILHVEDDFADAMLLQTSLCYAGAVDLNLDVARSLKDAKDKLSKNDYSIILADLRLPDSHHPQHTLTYLKNCGSGVPIVALSGTARTDIKYMDKNIAVLDKNIYLAERTPEKSKALLSKIMAPLEDPDEDILLI